MKLSLWSIGKPHEHYIKEGIEEFTKRISKYYPVRWVIIPTPKNAATLSEKDLKKSEADKIIQLLKEDDYLIALDEKGIELTSEKLATWLQARAIESSKNLVFLIGGAYGLSDNVLKRADLRWSLSRLTFPHQLVRLILAEQLYRACTILRNEKYHHK
ncbi:MAG: 23S rRNA (pseudouridine(1915)-N(3))-methyltransferase RlmH [Chitinophagaceae bacterium]